MTFQFHTTPVTEEEKAVFTPQLAMALDKRLELHSRRIMPGLWAVTDRLNRMPRASEAVRKRRRVRYRIYGVILLILGLLLLVPGLMEPKELAAPLAVGALATVSGILYLRPRRNGPRRRERKQAEQLLAAMAGSGNGDVAFAEEGVSVRAGESLRQIPYVEMDAVIETKDLLVLSFSKASALILKKRDMIEGEPAALLPFLAERTGLAPAKIDAGM